MRQRGHLGVGQARHPLHQVEQVYRHVEQCAALAHVESPRRPRAAHRAVTLERDRAQLAQLARLHQLAQPADHRLEPDLVCDTQHHAGVAAGGGHRNGFGQVDRQWLLAQHVLAVAGRGEHGCAVQCIGRADVDRIDRGVGGERFRIVVDAGHAVACGELARLQWRAAQAGDQFRAGALCDCRDHPLLDQAAQAHHAPANLAGVLLRPCCHVSSPVQHRLEYTSAPCSALGARLLARRAVDVPIRPSPRRVSRQAPRSRGRWPPLRQAEPARPASVRARAPRSAPACRPAAAASPSRRRAGRR